MVRKLERLSAGWGSWRWLAGSSQKQKNWFLGIVNKREGFEAWMSYLTRGLQNVDFLLKFENESDPWQRSKIVGQKISELQKSFKQLSREQRIELAKSAETELKTGLELMGRDKKTIQDLIELVDPPASS